MCPIFTECVRYLQNMSDTECVRYLQNVSDTYRMSQGVNRQVRCSTDWCLASVTFHPCSHAASHLSHLKYVQGRVWRVSGRAVSFFTLHSLISVLFIWTQHSLSPDAVTESAERRFPVSSIPGRVKPMTYTNLYLSLPTQALAIIRIWQGLVGSVSG